jgi:hypothetical protein
VWRSAGPLWEKDTRFCLDLNLVPGFNLVRIAPYDAVNFSTELASVEAAEGGCSAIEGAWVVPLPGARFTRGASHFEPNWFGGKGGRWLRGRSGFAIGTAGLEHPKVGVSFLATSFQDPREVVTSLDGRVLARHSVGTRVDRPDLVEVVIPPGQGVAHVQLTTTPGEYPAARENPDDPRQISILAGTLAVRSAP